MSESLCLKTVYDLRVDASDDPFRYYIPAYQRVSPSAGPHPAGSNLVPLQCGAT